MLLLTRGLHRKDTWGSGPWLSEPDALQWTDPPSGFRCAIARNFSGALCGYCAVPRGHPLYGVDYAARVLPPRGAMNRHVEGTRLAVMDLFIDAIDPKDDGRFPLSVALDVHCGLTYAGKGRILEGMRHPGWWWFGFDCGHAEDYAPAMMADMAAAGLRRGEFKLLWRPENYRTFEYVSHEVINLARQLEEWRHDPGEDDVELPKVLGAAEAAHPQGRRRKRRATARFARRPRRHR
jgi:hypothetical protein